MSTGRDRRVVSLLPAATEIACALGARQSLVGISHECDHPAEVQGLPVLTRPRLEGGGTSLDIDRGLRDLLGRALSIYELDLDALRDLRPEVILTQDLCAVCAVSPADLQRAAGELLGEVEVVSLRPQRLRDIPADIHRVARALGREEAGAALIAEMRERVAVLSHWAQSAAGCPRVLTIEWLEPVMLGGLWMPDLVRAAGGLPIGPQAGERAPTLDLDALRGLSPEVVLIKPCGFPLSRTLAELPLLPRVLPWSEWPAVAAGQVYVADGNAYFNRPGPRIVDSLEILAACLHPAVFPEHRAAYAGVVAQVNADLQARPLAPV